MLFRSSHPERTVRIRVTGDKGYITIKSLLGNSSISRYEWEKEIAVEEANELLKLCEPIILEKFRYLVKYKEHTFEVDEFLGENKGLIVAEIELECEDEEFDKPTWLGNEVTFDHKYINSYLSKYPYSIWNK